jgi:predicted nucleotidyltransferase
MTQPVPRVRPKRRSALSREDVLATLRAHERELRSHGAGALYLFGTIARDEAGPDSDVDLFFEENERARCVWAQFPDLEEYLSEILGGWKIDLIPRDSLHPVLRDRIEASAVQVF